MKRGPRSAEAVCLLLKETASFFIGEFVFSVNQGLVLIEKRREHVKIIGIDLSGPANAKDTVMTVFQTDKDKLRFVDMLTNATDKKLLSAIAAIVEQEHVVIGIDAPLSYQDGGGDRPQDKSLRRFIKGFGLVGGSVMPPTLTKMVYLSLRGIALTRTLMLQYSLEQLRIVEVHPGAAIGTRIGADHLHDVLHYKKVAGQAARNQLFSWLQTMGVEGIPQELSLTSHGIDSCAAALAAWHWAAEDKEPTWQWETVSPEHPFPFCC